MNENELDEITIEEWKASSRAAASILGDKQYEEVIKLAVEYIKEKMKKGSLPEVVNNKIDKILSRSQLEIIFYRAAAYEISKENREI